MTLIVIILIGVCAKLWHEVSGLKGRITSMERLYDGQSVAVQATRATSPVRRDHPEDRQRAGYVSPWAAEAQAPPPPGPEPVPVPEVDPVVIPSQDVVQEPRSAEPRVEVRAFERRPEPVRRQEMHREEVEQDSFSLEGLFGRTLPIWAGGITLAVAGVLVVKWSIDMGLVSPAVRVFMGLLFGLVLIGGAEFSLRGRISDDRIPQSLAGAGIASLYGALLAGNLMYDLLPEGLTLACMVAVTLAAGALSMRFGAPSAVLGLAGGLAAPALVGGGSPDVPLLSIYVAMVSGGIAGLARLQGRSWLGGLSIAGAALWAFLLIAGAAAPAPALALGGLMLFIGLAIPEILPADREGVTIRTSGALLAIVQTAMLVSMGGYGAVQWGMMAVATAVVLWTSERNDGFRDVPVVALGVLVAVVLAWPAPSVTALGMVVVLFSAMHALHAVRHLAFNEVPRVANGIRLIALPVVACIMVHAHVHPAGMTAFLLWGAGAMAVAGAIFLVSVSGLERISSYAQPLAIAMGTGALVPVLPIEALPVVLAASGATLLLVRGWRVGALAAAAGAVIWSLPALANWLVVSLEAVFSQPLLVTSLPSPWEIAWSVLPAIVAAALLAWREDLVRRPAAIVAAVLGGVACHVLWRNVVGISSHEEFVASGLFDRTAWEALLAMMAVAAWQVDRRVSAGLALASLFHFAWFTLLRYDPFWSEQFVGPVPFLNLALLSHAVPLALLWACGRCGLDENLERARRICQMVVILAMGMAVLRQLFAGSMPFGVPVSDAEDIMRSVLAIAIALGFLLYGIWSSSIEWRAGSLVLMLGAVTKVFLFDAAGLDGLARVASFAALGFSLIGVGWLYSRLLPEGGRA